MNKTVTYQNIDRTAIIQIDNPPVNALGHQVRTALIQSIDRIDADDNVDAVIIMGSGRLFSAGADIKEFDLPRMEPHLTKVTLRFDNAAKPLIAAIHATAFGGALELALSCNFRICSAGTNFGLPEVKLGILPGASGTQRLPRLIGLVPALQMIATGAPISASKALDLKLVDKIVDGDKPDELLKQALLFTHQIVANNTSLKRTCDPLEGLGINRDARTALGDARQLAAKKMRGQIAPQRAIDSVEIGLTTTFSKAIANDRKIFKELKNSSQSAALRYAFFAERQASKIPGIDRDTEVRPIDTAGVIGAGTMGTGIAISLANAGIAVILIDARDEALENGQKTIGKIYDLMATRGRISNEECSKRKGLITPYTQIENLSDVDLVIEAVFEDMDLKKKIFRSLDQICKSGTILASNSSSLDINLFAATTKRPKDVCGLHFFSPANIMKLLEIVRTDEASDETIATAMALAKRLGKTGVLAGVCSGYAANRSRQPFVQEAMFLIEDGATPEQIDQVLTDFGMPLGPMAVADLAGTDISYMVRKSQKSNWNPKARYPYLADQIAQMGRHGRKTGMGWYKYGNDRKTPIPDPQFTQITKDFRQQHNINARKFSNEEILERCLLAAVNEAGHILQEGMALRASDIDLMWLTGFAFPPHKGGIMHYADEIGLTKVYGKICKYREQMGEQWRPSQLLKDLAKKDGKFSQL